MGDMTQMCIVSGVEDFKYLRAFFMSERRMEQEMDQRIGAVVKTEMSVRSPTRPRPYPHDL